MVQESASRKENAPTSFLNSLAERQESVKDIVPMPLDTIGKVKTARGRNIDQKCKLIAARHTVATQRNEDLNSVMHPFEAKR